MGLQNRLDSYFFRSRDREAASECSSGPGTVEMKERDTESLIGGGGNENVPVSDRDYNGHSEEFIARVRDYNREGPHFFYGEAAGG